jgi:hypothetical protein
MARAAVPMFWPSCGSTSTTAGPSIAVQDLVLSVPEPGMQCILGGQNALAQALPKLAACVKRWHPIRPKPGGSRPGSFAERPPANKAFTGGVRML